VRGAEFKAEKTPCQICTVNEAEEKEVPLSLRGNFGIAYVRSLSDSSKVKKYVRRVSHLPSIYLLCSFWECLALNGIVKN
jgi:hypothetical protein